MAQSDELRLMTKVARLYHEQALTQSQIATQLNLSQATVSRLLRRAQEAQIIRIVPAQPTVIYVPVYEPEVIYYRPVDYFHVRTPYWSFGVGYPIGGWLASLALYSSAEKWGVG